MDILILLGCVVAGNVIGTLLARLLGVFCNGHEQKYLPNTYENEKIFETLSDMREILLQVNQKFSDAVFRTMPIEQSSCESTPCPETEGPVVLDFSSPERSELTLEEADALWLKYLEKESKHDQVSVPLDFPIFEDDIVSSLEKDGKIIELILWIRKGQTLEEVAKQRGYVLNEYPCLCD